MLHKVFCADRIKTLGNRKHQLTYNWDNDVSFLCCFDQIDFKLAGNEDRHTISDDFELRPDRTTPYGVSALEHLKSSYS